MTEVHQDRPVLVLVPDHAEDVAALVQAAGWHVETDWASVARADAVLIDRRARSRARIPEDMPPLIACIALVDDRQTAERIDTSGQGFTHILPWPVSEALLAATLEGALVVRRRLGEAMRTVIAGEGREVATSGAVHDGLTGLASRRFAREWLDARLAGGTGEGIQACLLIGISQFASINIAYGQGTGDAVLARVAARIERCVRSAAGNDGEQALVARMGGTEYLVACADGGPGKDGIDPRELARTILSDVSRPFVADDKVIRLTARCGLAFAAPGDDASSLLRRANGALADARRSATSDMSVRSGVRKRGKAGADDVDRLDADLRLALHSDEIGIVYQPQYDSHTDRVIGVEALARWNHPQLGQLDAGTLFEAADRSDYLLPLSLHIQRTALNEAGRWPASLSDLRLSVNVTAADLAQEDFVARMLAMIRESGFPSNRLTVEITETGLIENIDRAGAVLRELRRHELSVAIDDFGTGYSSLAYLKALHPDYLKIDHSLSRDILGTPRDRIILRAIIAMARSLALTVIAEGVESEEQLTLLAREGCEIYQGFLRSPAVTSEELVQLIGQDGR